MDKQPSAPASPSSPSHEQPDVEHTTPQSNSAPMSHEPSSQEDYSSSQLLDQSSSPLDLERHPKGKRKRTAAKDKSVLEAAYHANPKPDKAARLEIVKRVSLNEKEVQIWFQNRRQNDRRKSRPLSPQEIAALRYGGMQILSSDPAAPYNSSPNANSTNHSPNHGHSFTEARPSSSARSDPGVFHRETQDDTSGQKDDQANTNPRNQSPNVAATAQSQEADTTTDSFQLSRSFPSSVGYLSNRWNTGSSFSTPSTVGHRTVDDSIKLEPFSLSTCSSAPHAAPVLPAPNSQAALFRLSLSLEGKAQVIESTTPPHIPPPRPSAEALAALPPARRPSFHRGHSAKDTVTLPPLSNLTNSLPAPNAGALPPRLTRGRSRDVHAWQFACEVDSQEEPLIAQAKHESNGSAIAAISLLRTTSSSGAAASSPLQPGGSAKRNAAMSRAVPRTGAAKKPKLARASTSVARLQTSYDAHKKPTHPHKEVAPIEIPHDKSKLSTITTPSGNDSDKENWSPDEEGNPHYRFNSPDNPASSVPSPGKRRPLPSSSLSKQQPLNSRRGGNSRILQEQRPSLFGNRANTAPAFNRNRGAGGKAGVEIFEDGGDSPSRRSPGKENRAVVVDDEVERFMRGEVSPSKKGDVDAVAGLLSLSQGNWR
ncbi:hypothetical protein GE09DRAFT_444640 [Coniochaeta sp. 2T2.1]|nr:hypothetical protein GE09DRAFT_444640 [Coniochaeta sp. 2T2.1]